MVLHHLPANGNLRTLYQFDKQEFNAVMQLVYKNTFLKDGLPPFLALMDLYDITTSRLFVHLYTRLFFGERNKTFVPGTWGLVKDRMKGLVGKGLKLHSTSIMELEDARRRVVAHASQFNHFIEGFESAKATLKADAHTVEAVTTGSPKDSGKFETITGLILEDKNGHLEVIRQCNDYTEDIVLYQYKKGVEGVNDEILCEVEEKYRHLMFEKEHIGKHVPHVSSLSQRNLFFILASRWWNEDMLIRKVENRTAFPLRVTREEYDQFMDLVLRGYLAPFGWFLVKRRGRVRLCWIPLTSPLAKKVVSK